ncbi:MAG: hypothetical protein AAB451_03105 [Patescibacteria group bacterium]
MLKKILSFLPQIIASFFLAGFVAYAWTGPTGTPPNNNVDAPINVGTTTQTKQGDFIVNGVIKTLKDLIVGSVTIKSDGSVSPGLNAEKAENSQKLGGYSASDVSNSGKVTGTITIGGSLWGGVCGGWGCNGCVCYENTTCSVQGKGLCDGTTQSWGVPNAPVNFTTYQPVCNPGETLTLIGTQGINQSCYSPLSCPTKTYQCVKPSINFPGCGNGILEAGENCDDGNQLNNIGNCTADCQKYNYFSSVLIPGSGTSGWVSGYPTLVVTNATQYCKEKGFSGVVKYNNLNYPQSNCWPWNPNACPFLNFWDGSSWKTIQQQALVLSELWCQ